MVTILSLKTQASCYLCYLIYFLSFTVSCLALYHDLNHFRSSVEGFFASKGAAYAIPDGDFARKASLKGGEYIAATLIFNQTL